MRTESFNCSPRHHLSNRRIAARARRIGAVSLPTPLDLTFGRHAQREVQRVAVATVPTFAATGGVAASSPEAILVCTSGSSSSAFHIRFTTIPVTTMPITPAGRVIERIPDNRTASWPCPERAHNCGRSRSLAGSGGGSSGRPDLAL